MYFRAYGKTLVNNYDNENWEIDYNQSWYDNSGIIYHRKDNGNYARRFYANDTLNQNIIIGNEVKNCYAMMAQCTNFGKAIYFKGNVYRFMNTVNMIRGTKNSLRKEIWFNSVFNNRFNVASTLSIVGNNITWTDMDNGFYNATYNIYCYNNYAG